ncbi:hypothetical protein BNJ_00103 [Kaumoebavirus]|uniref:hypothetical protein n=1 Tax=Kaumoebavirus TaxID=1859492 RepID=UPI0009C37506|nr:hypothetical protein BNJ_00103 [Kaumoebavirus]ARA71940.1 hypothetical protein BNJ_00103 [Kaumoebavirus]
MIGTSGYSYPHWKSFYKGPSSLPKYAEHFSTVELNNTFYKFPTPDNIEKWKSEVPKHFIFAVKAPLLITHRYRLGARAWPILRKFLRVAKGFGRQLGPILFQFPPTFHENAENVKRVRKLIKACKGFVIALEFRHQSWDFESPTKSWPKNATLVLPINPDTTLAQIKKWLTLRTDVPFIYVRFHPDKLYRRSLKKIWAALEKTKTPKKYIYFNNDLRMYALEDAAVLKRIAG